MKNAQLVCSHFNNVAEAIRVKFGWAASACILRWLCVIGFGWHKNKSLESATKYTADVAVQDHNEIVSAALGIFKVYKDIDDC